MSPLDKESIQSKVARIRLNLVELRKLAKIPLKEYMSSIQHTAVAERLLQISIEAMLDIGSHIIAEEGLGEPLEYRNVFMILSQARILPRNKEKQFLNMVGLRKRIVHLYEDMDHKKIHQFLKRDLADFETFVEIIAHYISR